MNTISIFNSFNFAMPVAEGSQRPYGEGEGHIPDTSQSNFPEPPDISNPHSRSARPSATFTLEISFFFYLILFYFLIKFLYLTSIVFFVSSVFFCFWLVINRLYFFFFFFSVILLYFFLLNFKFHSIENWFHFSSSVYGLFSFVLSVFFFYK